MELVKGFIIQSNSHSWLNKNSYFVCRPSILNGRKHGPCLSSTENWSNFQPVFQFAMENYNTELSVIYVVA